MIVSVDGQVVQGLSQVQSAENGRSEVEGTEMERREKEREKEREGGSE